MSTRESLPCTKCDSYLNQSLTNVPSILSHFSSSNASVFDRSAERLSRNAETELVWRLQHGSNKAHPQPLGAAVHLQQALDVGLVVAALIAHLRGEDLGA